MNTSLTLQIPTGMEHDLNRLADAVGVTPHRLAVDAIKVFLETQDWQVVEIKQALIEVQAKDFATEGEVRAVYDKWR